jgi:tripartite-type tricarboxylate transporter receptor subunit TctC
MTFLSTFRPTFEALSSCLWLACLVFGSVANAQTTSWPERPIRLVTPVGVGVAADIVMRKIAPELSKALGQAVIVENRPGASGRIALSEAAHAAPDGYTFGMADAGSLLLLPAMGAKLAYDPQKDFIPVARVQAAYALIAVSVNSPILKLSDLQNLGRPVTVGMPGVSTFQHVQCLSLSKALSFECNPVSYSKGNFAALLDVGSGNTDMAFTFVSESKGLVEGGKIRILATLAPKRNPMLPHVPSITEFTTSMPVLPSWFGLFAPAGTPVHIVDRMRTEINKVLVGDTYKPWMESLGTQVEALEGPSFTQFLEGQRVYLKSIVDTYGLKSE